MFVAWNPNINPLCTNLARLIGNYICLSRPDGLLTPNITLPNAGALATASVWPRVVPTIEAQLPRAPGTLTGCTQYTNYRDAVEMDSFYQPQFREYSAASNQCRYVASKYGVSVVDLMMWNPSLNTPGTDSMNCTLAPGYSYCARLGNTTIPSPPTKACIPANSTLIPQGTTSSCNCYTVITGYDVDVMDCEILAEDQKITLASLQSWNPWLAGSLTACKNALFSGLEGGADRQVCVGTGAGSSLSSPLSTTSPSSSSARTDTTSNTSTRTTTTTSSAHTPVSSTPGSACVAGTDTGNPNQAGLCSFSCHYGFCPSGPCVCTAYGTLVPSPPTTGVAGYKLAWEDDSYIELCNFVYNHGYYPTGACTTHSDGSPQA
ncbi:glycoside family 71 protein [Rhypophila decipiens]